MSFSSHPIHYDLAGVARPHRLEAVAEIVDADAVGDDRRKVKAALDEGDHLVPGLEHLAAIDALEIEHLEDHLVPVDLETGRRNAENGDLAAIVHLIDHVAEGGCC